MTTLDAVKTLHTSMIDTRRAYEKAHKEAEEPQLKALFAEMVALKQRDHGELHHVLIMMGEKPSDDGSFMTTVHKAVIGVRAAVKEIDRDSLDAFASGERNIVKEYDDALGQSDLRPETAGLLRRQKSALLAKIDEMTATGRSA